MILVSVVVFFLASAGNMFLEKENDIGKMMVSDDHPYSKNKEWLAKNKEESKVHQNICCAVSHSVSVCHTGNEGKLSNSCVGLLLISTISSMQHPNANTSDNTYYLTIPVMYHFRSDITP